MKKRLMVLMVSIFAGLAGFLVATTASAEGIGSAIIGTEPTGGKCGGNGSTTTWWDTCFGYSWQKYEVIKDLPAEGIHFHTTASTGEVVYITGCEAGQELYNYGLETYKPDYNLTSSSLTLNRGGYSIKYFESGYQVSTQKNKDGAMAPHASTGAKGVFTSGLGGTQPNADINSYIKVLGYAEQGGPGNSDENTVYIKFQKMKDYLNKEEHKEEAQNIFGADVEWKDVGAFCWDDKYDNPEPDEFYANSKVEANKVGASLTRTAETGIVRQDSDASTTLVIRAGESVKIVFSHDLYSKEKVINNKTWDAERNFNSGVSMGGNTTKTVTGATEFTGRVSSGDGKGKYAADNNGRGNPVLKDTYNNVKFDNPGLYRFCESITIDTVTTRACVEVDVERAGEPVCTGTECECYGTNCPIPSPSKPCGFSIPSSYSSSNSMSGTTSVISRVKNVGITDFNTTVYAKPGDSVAWCNAYYPGVQKAAEATVTQAHPGHDTELSGLINYITNGPFRELGWANQFNITSVNVRPYYSESRNFGIGNSDPQSSSNSTSVGTDQVGQTLSETITSGYPSSVSAYSGVGPHTWGCHWKEDKSCGVKETIKENCRIITERNECPIVIGGRDPHCKPFKIFKKCDERDVYNECYVDTCRDSDLYYGYSQGGTASDTSYVHVPYNFRNTATVNIRDSLVYAGETMTIGSATVTVGGKQNDKTKGFYATRVDGAQTKLVGYLSSSSTGTAKDNYGNSNICSALPVKNGNCNELNSYTGMTLNSGGVIGFTSSLGFAGQSYNVYDAKAGDYYCVVAAVYPSTSGADTNLGAYGDRNWYISAPSCRVIAKKPSFQVWGGSVYSEKSVKTSVAEKNNLTGIYGYSTSSKSSTTVFGSWVEQAVISNGLVSGLASGAATGELAVAPWSGSKEGAGVSYCTYRVPLSIANFSTIGEQICPNYQQTGNAGLSNVAIDRDALMNYWGIMGVSYVEKASINLAKDFVETKSIQGNLLRYTEPVGSISQISLSAATIPKGITHIVWTSGNVRIDGNIVYENTTYRAQKEIPKLLIYAKGNIVISCNVDRVDAIIVAEGQVKTCDSDSVNSRANSRQLTINGMIVTDSLVLNRTYGAKEGSGSGIPAEIINYDTSAIVWGNNMAEANDFETLTTVYQHEIAPRY